MITRVLAQRVRSASAEPGAKGKVTGEGRLKIALRTFHAGSRIAFCFAPRVRDTMHGVLVALSLTPAPALAQSDFYKGKTIDLVISTGRRRRARRQCARGRAPPRQSHSGPADDRAEEHAGRRPHPRRQLRVQPGAEGRHHDRHLHPDLRDGAGAGAQQGHPVRSVEVQLARVDLVEQLARSTSGTLPASPRSRTR